MMPPITGFCVVTGLPPSTPSTGLSRPIPLTGTVPPVAGTVTSFGVLSAGVPGAVAAFAADAFLLFLLCFWFFATVSSLTR